MCAYVGVAMHCSRPLGTILRVPGFMKISIVCACQMRSDSRLASLCALQKDAASSSSCAMTQIPRIGTPALIPMMFRVRLPVISQVVSYSV